MAIGKANRIVPRKKLLALMNSFSEQRALFICAPAGHGKSVAAALWLDSLHLPSAIITLDAYSNSMSDFCRMFCAALLCLQPESEVLRAIAGHDGFEGAPEEFVLRAVNALPVQLRAALVLDDLHEMQAPSVCRLLVSLLNRLPEGICICILSREEPQQSFSDFLLKNELALITAEALQFSCEEVYVFFRENGKEITKAQAAQLQEYTDGWAIGINAILLSDGELPTGRIVQSHLESYIKSQLWERWPPQTREFMLQTAMEDDLTGPLCSALTGENAAEKMLEALVRQNAFLSPVGGGVYRFHRLFRAFLRRQVQAVPGLEGRQLKRAAEWYLQRKEYYRAAERFAACEDHAGIARCFYFLENMEHAGFMFEKMLPAMRLLREEVLAAYPFLLYMPAYSAFLEGRREDMLRCMDQYYARYPAILAQTPQFAHNILYLKAIDTRASLQELAQELQQMPAGPQIKGIKGSVTQKMPLLHRSVRDFSEFAVGDTDALLWAARDVIGGLLGTEQDVLVDCLRAGLRYEQGSLAEAHSIALQANANMEPSFSAETKFCAMSLLAHILRVMWQLDDARLVVRQIEEMVERERAYYLSNNFQDIKLRMKMEEGTASHLQEWVQAYEQPFYEQITFYGLYRHFTMARALLALSRQDQAIVLLRKLLELCRGYSRPLDCLEAKVLLAIAIWKKPRGSQKEALQMLEEALTEAYPFGYTQVFVTEGADLVNLLYRLQARVDHGQEAPLLSSFTKKIYTQALLHARRGRGAVKEVAGGAQFTKKQWQVMRLLCEGKSYREIAESLGIKFSTVRSHLELIYRKLDVPNATEAILKIRELDLLEE